jgi:hypothetical protein
MILDINEASALKSISHGLCHGELIIIAAMEEVREVNELFVMPS